MSVHKGPEPAAPPNQDTVSPDPGLLRRRKLYQAVTLDVSLPASEPAFGSSLALPMVDLDLSQKIKVIFINGRGNTGKTVLLRLIGEVQLLSGRRFRLAACDIGSRAARRYFKKINMPDTNDIYEIIEFLKAALQDSAETGVRYVIDMGAAGETAILRLNEQIDVVRACQDIGVTPVFIHMIGTSVDDVSVLASFEQRGLRPSATALIFNEMSIGLGSRPETAFELVEAQPCVQDALRRGAALLRLPGLDRRIATEVEARQLLYKEAVDGVVGNDESLGPIGPFDRSELRIWRDKALLQLSPISTWLGLPPIER